MHKLKMWWFLIYLIVLYCLLCIQDIDLNCTKVLHKYFYSFCIKLSKLKAKCNVEIIMALHLIVLSFIYSGNRSKLIKIFDNRNGSNFNHKQGREARHSGYVKIMSY